MTSFFKTQLSREGTRDLFSDQWAEVVEVLSPHSVVDFGSGDLSRAQYLALNGCAKVMAIDKLPCPVPMIPFNLQYRQGYFQDVEVSELQGYTAGLVSWPNVYNVHSLPKLLENLDVVVYRGFNFEGTACGDDALWEHFRHREVLQYLPLRNNIVIVYGAMGPRRNPDDLYLEEIAAADREKIMSYSDSAETLNQVLSK